MSGPLAGVRIVEVGSIGPAPFGTMLLADLGADVVRVERPSVAAEDDRRFDVMLRGRRSVTLDLKVASGIHDLLALADRADVLIEGFRPGVMERLGVGPDECMSRNPRLIYARMTGWGQEGPMAALAGHDINYISIAGVLAHLQASDGVPTHPLNLVGDFGGGGMLLALGVCAALVEARTSGLGQVVDAAMVDGAALLMTMFHGNVAAAAATGAPSPFNAMTEAPYYGVFRCADDGFISIGAFEPPFYAQLLELLGVSDHPDMADNSDQDRWPAMRAVIADRIRTRTRDEWVEASAGYDACMTPVLTMFEARDNAHLRHRATFVTIDGVTQPAPAPRLSRTPAGIPSSPAEGLTTVDRVLSDW